MQPKSCPKCFATMQLGFPVESMLATGWSEQTPREAFNLLAGPAFMARDAPQHVLMGFSCTQCGFVELYKVSKAQLQPFLAAEAG